MSDGLAQTCSTSGVAMATNGGDVGDLRQENDALQQQLVATKTELLQSTARLQALEKQVQQQESKFAKARADHHKDYIAECDSLKGDIASLTGELTRLQNELSIPPSEDSQQGQTATDGGGIGGQKISRLFKIVLVGDSGVGKTTFIRHLCLGERATPTSSTVGVDFYTKLMTVQGQCTSLKIWDTAGTERFRSITKSYFRDANGVILVYDVTAVQSFSHVRQWMGDILDNADDSVVVMVMGNKTDMAQDSSVLTNHGRTLADSYRSLFSEVSARTGTGIVDAVAMMVRAMQDVEDEQIRRTRLVVELNLDNDAPKTSCC